MTTLAAEAVGLRAFVSRPFWPALQQVDPGASGGYFIKSIGMVEKWKAPAVAAGPKCGDHAARRRPTPERWD